MKKKIYKQPVCKVHEIKMRNLLMQDVSSTPVEEGKPISEDPIGVKSRNDNWEEF